MKFAARSPPLNEGVFPMKHLMTALALAAFSAGALASSAVVGQPAPAFSAKDTTGRSVALADFKGKHVVLEWVNPGCPYVRKHYDAKNMQATQKGATDKGVVWLAVNSTAPEYGDYLAPGKMAAWMKDQGAAATATLMDEDGKVGRAYGARTTPHMYVIDPAGKLVYAGAIDNKPTASKADIPGATNHVSVALAESLAGKPVSTASTRAYGCTVKYSNSGE
jgi:peroxiredoxin